MLAALIAVAKIPGPGSGRARALLLANGLLLGLHWTTFFLAVHIANVSVCMIGMATSTLWTALLEPALVKERRYRAYEFVIGSVMVGAIALIAGGDFQYRFGLMIAIFSSGVATVFSIFNSRFTRQHHHYTIAMYQMAGALVFCVAGTVVMAAFRGSVPDLVPSWKDAGLLFLLASICTVYAYSQYIELLKRLSVFTVHLAYNLEPVYGILLAAAFFKEHEQMGSTFYLGAAIILAAVITQPFIERVYRRRLRRLKPSS